METIVCDNCHTSATTVLQQETEILRLPDPYRIVRCNQCHLVYMNPRMTAAEYTAFYSSKYYDDYAYDDILSQERAPKFERRMRHLDMMKPSRGLLLDIGTATGEFLHVAQQHGWQVKGTEVSAFAAAEANKKYGIDVFVGEAHNAPFPPRSIDVIHLSHVLEHVPSPRQSLRTIRNLLKDDGIMVLEVPNQFANWFDRFADALGRRHRLKEPSMHHVYFYTPKTLRMLVEAEGFSVTVRTYSMHFPYAGTPKFLHPLFAILTRCIDAFGGGLFIEAYATKRPQ